MNYYQPTESKVFTFQTDLKNTITINKSDILNAIHYSHEILNKFKDFDVDVFSILGMRNLSAFIGEIFAASVIRETNGLFRKNPHQDGYPDLLTMDEAGQKLWNSLRLRDKQPFSPFKNGGIEIKATCGSVPTPKMCEKKNLTKPDIGHQRISMLIGYDWKAHHRDTNNLLGILWDFIDGVPRITAVFFSNNLTNDDWGKIVQPIAGGGRTTSVSIMTRDAVKKMYEGALFVLNDKKYKDFLNAHNKGKLLK